MRPTLCAMFLIALVTPLGASAAVRYVDPGNASARDSGTGGASHPYRTLGYAMKMLKPGDTLDIAPGVYRETLRFPDRDWSSAQTTIQSVPGSGEALIKGSNVVSGWKTLASGLFVKRNWPVQSEQVFIDGKALKQIGGTVFGGYPEKRDNPLARVGVPHGIWPGRIAGGLKQMVPGSFFYDAATHSLYVKSKLASLKGHHVEASVRTYLAFGKNLRHVTLRNLRFEHSNTTAVAQTGAVTLLGDHLLLEHLFVSHADGAGFDISGNSVVIRDSRAVYCGQVGIKLRGENDKLLDDVVSFNNTRGFNRWWEAGGVKLVGAGGMRDSEVAGLTVIGNNGDGIWFDWMNRNDRVHGNVVAYNRGMGIQYEASQRAYIYDNYVFSNAQRGIYLPDASGSVVAHNLVVRNGLEGVAIVDENRPSKRAVLVPRDNVVFGNILAWNGKGELVLPAGGLGNVSDYNLFVYAHAAPSFSLGWGTRASPRRQGLSAWQAASGQDRHSWSVRRTVPQALEYTMRARRGRVPWDALRMLARTRRALAVRAPHAGSLPAVLRVAAPPGPQRALAPEASSAEESSR